MRQTSDEQVSHNAADSPCELAITRPLAQHSGKSAGSILLQETNACPQECQFRLNQFLRRILVKFPGELFFQDFETNEILRVACNDLILVSPYALVQAG
jgi:hypothetical protein